jgi:hypothetical protein
MTTTSALTATGYVDAVRQALGDLTFRQVAELTDGLEEHLGEVSAETGSDLTELVGAPEDYAAELRRSAGFALASDIAAPTVATPPSPAAHTDTPQGVRVATPPVDPRPEARTVAPTWRDDLSDMRKLWWLARGLIAAAALGVATAEDPKWQAFGNLPFIEVGDSWALGLATVVLCVLGSRRLSRRGGMWRNVERLATAAGIIGLVVVLLVARQGRARFEYPSYFDTFEPQTATTLGRPLVLLPDVRGIVATDAVRVLQEQGVGVTIVHDTSGAPRPASAFDVVTRSDPAPGTQIPLGSTVTLFVGPANPLEQPTTDTAPPVTFAPNPITVPPTTAASATSTAVTTPG